MKQGIRSYRHIVLILFLLSLTIAACGSSGEDDGNETAAVSGQAAAQEPAEPAVPGEDQEAAENQVSEPSVAEPAEQTTSDEAADTAASDESPAETGEETGAISPTALEEIQAMQVVMVVENLDSGETMEASYSFVRPDRFLISIMGLDRLAAGDTTYLRANQGQWAEQANLPAEVTARAVEEVMDAFTHQATIYELLDDPGDSGFALMGEETLNGIETLVYFYNGGITSPLTGLINGEVKVWIGKADGLLYRQEVENSTDSGLGPRSRGIVEIVYGDAVTIEEPD